MAFQRVTNFLYVCLSTDTKETSGILGGAECIESDTGDRFEYDGNSWNPVSTNGAAHVVQAQTSLVDLGTITQNTWIDISKYKGKKITWVVDSATDDDIPVEFGDDGVSAFSHIKQMNLNPNGTAGWDNGTSGVEQFWTTNIKANYIRFPDISAVSSINLYGSVDEIERDFPVLIKENAYIMSDDSVPALNDQILRENEAYDPFVLRTTIDAEGTNTYGTGGKNLIVAAEYAGYRSSGVKWAMHKGPFLLNPCPYVISDRSKSAAGNIATFGKGTTSSIMHADKFIFHVRTMSATSITVEVANDESQNYTAVNVKDLSDGTYKAITATGVYMLEGPHMNVQLTQVGAGNTDVSTVITSSGTPMGTTAVQSIEFGKWGGPIRLKNISNVSSTTLYIHEYY